MNNRIVSLLSAAYAWTLSVNATNLTFDNPDLSHLRTELLVGEVGPVGELFRGWEVSIRPPASDWTSFTADVQYSYFPGGAGPVALNFGMHQDPSDLSVRFSDYPIHAGPTGSVNAEVQLRTRETVPIGADKLKWIQGIGLTISVRDDIRSVTVKGEVGELDVSGFAGKEVEISFISSGSTHDHLLDVTGFTLIPEPGQLELASVGTPATGVVWLLARRKRNRNATNN